EHAPKGVLARGGAELWKAKTQGASYRAWAGYAFESVCFKHAAELQHALKIENLVENMGTWGYVARGKGDAQLRVQVALLFDRRDGVINICEMKFSAEPFVVTKTYARELKSKLELFEARTRTRKRLVMTLVTAGGLKKNAWSEDLVDRV